MSITVASLLFLFSPVFSHGGTDTALVQEMDVISPVVLISSAGSTCAGSLVDGDGAVVTAYHCIERRRPIVVTNSAGEQFDAEVTHTDRRNDLALLSVGGLTGSLHFDLGGQAVVGEDVTVVGHPFGSLAIRVPVLDGLLRWSVTEGNVAAVGNSLIQLDSAINPGTSGGPVLDREGQLIGVISRKLRGESLAFAVPSERVADILEGDQPPFLSGSMLLNAAMLLPVDVSTPSLLLGPALEISDRLIVEGRLGVPVGAKWRTLAIGQTSWRTWEAQTFWRFRLSTNYNSFTAEVGGGVAGVASQSGSMSTDGRFQPMTTYEPPITTASIRVGIGGWKLGVVAGSDGDWALTVGRLLVGRLLRF